MSDETLKNTDQSGGTDTGIDPVNNGAAGASEPVPGSAEYWEAKAKKAEEERDNYKQGLLNEKDKSARAAQAATQQPAVDVESIRTQVADQVRAELSVDMHLNSLGVTGPKAEVVKSIYQTRIQKSGTDGTAILNDLKDALFLADKEIIIKQNEEMGVAMNNRGSSFVNASVGSHQGHPIPEVGYFSKAQEAEIEKISKKFGVKISAKDVITTMNSSKKNGDSK